ncbi:MAG: hypothetical protein LBB11_02220 [Puniceicoccales bacterium]|jgi:hypothetical protein|nr:hypothetical protein [Puniceicoccales bacterium]
MKRIFNVSFLAVSLLAIPVAQGFKEHNTLQDPAIMWKRLDRILSQSTPLNSYKNFEKEQLPRIQKRVLKLLKHCGNEKVYEYYINILKCALFGDTRRIMVQKSLPILEMLFGPEEPMTIDQNFDSLFNDEAEEEPTLKDDIKDLIRKVIANAQGDFLLNRKKSEKLEKYSSSVKVQPLNVQNVKYISMKLRALADIFSSVARGITAKKGPKFIAEAKLWEKTEKQLTAFSRYLEDTLQAFSGHRISEDPAVGWKTLNGELPHSAQQDQYENFEKTQLLSIRENVLKLLRCCGNENTYQYYMKILEYGLFCDTHNKNERPILETLVGSMAFNIMEKNFDSLFNDEKTKELELRDEVKNLILRTITNAKEDFLLNKGTLEKLEECYTISISDVSPLLWSVRYISMKLYALANIFLSIAQEIAKGDLIVEGNSITQEGLNVHSNPIAEEGQTTTKKLVAKKNQMVQGGPMTKADPMAMAEPWRRTGKRLIELSAALRCVVGQETQKQKEIDATPKQKEIDTATQKWKEINAVLPPSPQNVYARAIADRLIAAHKAHTHSDGQCSNTEDIYQEYIKALNYGLFCDQWMGQQAPVLEILIGSKEFEKMAKTFDSLFEDRTSRLKSSIKEHIQATIETLKTNLATLPAEFKIQSTLLLQLWYDIISAKLNALADIFSVVAQKVFKEKLDSIAKSWQQIGNRLVELSQFIKRKIWATSSLN